MVENGYVEGMACFPQLAGQLDVGGTWRRVAARVVVDANYRRTACEHRDSEDLAGMGQSSRRRTHRNAVASKGSVFAVENDDVEGFSKGDFVESTAHVFDDPVGTRDGNDGTLLDELV